MKIVLVMLIFLLVILTACSAITDCKKFNENDCKHDTNCKAIYSSSCENCQDILFVACVDKDSQFQENEKYCQKDSDCHWAQGCCCQEAANIFHTYTTASNCEMYCLGVKCEDVRSTRELKCIENTCVGLERDNSVSMDECTSLGGYSHISEEFTYGCPEGEEFLGEITDVRCVCSCCKKTNELGFLIEITDTIPNYEEYKVGDSCNDLCINNVGLDIVEQDGKLYCQCQTPTRI